MQSFSSPSFLRGFALALLLSGAGSVSGQSTPDAVELLRQTLKASARDLDQRAQAIQAHVEGLHGITELRRALALKEWRDEDVDPQVAAVDLRQRAVIVERFEALVRHGLASGDPMTRITVADTLADLGVSARGAGHHHGAAHVFGPELAKLAVQGDARVREAAARALGQINPDFNVALPPLTALLHAPEDNLRATAAAALVNLVKTTAQAATSSHEPGCILCTRRELTELGRAIVPVAAQGLRDPSVAVRRLSVEAIGRTASALSRLVLDPSPGGAAMNLDDCRKEQEEERADLLPLILALRDQAPALAQALGDPDAQVRALTRRTLEVMADLRLRWQRRAATESATTDDPLLDGLRTTLLSLSASLSDPDRQARQTAINVLETLGPAAAPATGALVETLADRDRFVRWGAARALGKIGPTAAPAAVPGLTVLLNDPDLDLRLAALATLQRFGPAAQAAVPALMQSLAAPNAAEMRVETIHVLGAIGLPYAQPAVPTLAGALADPDMRVRLAAATALGKLGPAAREAVEALRKARLDRNLDVQQAAAAALLQIVQP